MKPRRLSALHAEVTHLLCRSARRIRFPRPILQDLWHGFALRSNRPHRAAKGEFQLRRAVLCLALSVVAFLLAATLAEARDKPYGSQSLVRLVGNRPAVNVVVNGQGPFLFLIDTATSHTVFTPGLRDKLGLRAMPGPAVDVVTAAGSVSSQYYMIAETGASGVIVEGVRAVVLDLPESLGIMGALGADFLSNFVVDLDFRAHTITLYPEKAEVRIPGLKHIKGMTNGHNFIVLPAMIGSVKAYAVFDSGAAYTVGNPTLGVTAKSFGMPILRLSTA